MYAFKHPTLAHWVLVDGCGTIQMGRTREAAERAEVIYAPNDALAAFAEGLNFIPDYVGQWPSFLPLPLQKAPTC